LGLLSAAAGCREAREPRPTVERAGAADDLDPEPSPPDTAPVADTLVVAVPRLPESLDPLEDLDPWGRRIADDLVFEGLVRRRPQAAPWVDMALADRCLVEERAVVCHLRPGTRFSDGRPVGMDDVVYSLRYWVDPRRSWIRQRHGLGSLRQVEVVDAPPGGEGRDPGRWVRVGFAQREPLALERLAAVKIVPEASHRRRGTPFGRAPIGTGPMRVVGLEADRLELERVDPATWTRTDRPLPALARIVLREVDDGAQALTLLRRGQVHILPDLAPNHVPVELGRPGMAARFAAFVRSPGRFDALLWNLRGGATRQPGLRRALDAGLPRSAIGRVAIGAPSLPLRAPVDLHDPTPLDLDQLADVRADRAAEHGLRTFAPAVLDVAGAVTARAMLDGLGYLEERGLRARAGVPLRITLMTDGAGGRAGATARLVRDAWRGIGVQVPSATAPWGYLLTLLRKGTFDVALVTFAQQEDEDLFAYFHSRGDLNLAGVADAQLDAALEEFRAATDREGRRRAKVGVAARLAALDVASMLHAPAPVCLISLRVHGLAWQDDLPVLDGLSLAPDPGG
jgi:ABC-type transport system substrate-binding protein